MALTSEQIVKLTPQNNCRSCGCKDCKEFADKVKNGQIEIYKCKYIPEVISDAVAMSVRYPFGVDFADKKYAPLTEWQLFRLLPNSDCGVCGCDVCKRFASRVHAKEKNINECPFIPDEIKDAVYRNLNPKKGFGSETAEADAKKAFRNLHILLDILEKKSLGKMGDSEYAILENGKDEWQNSIETVKGLLNKR